MRASKLKAPTLIRTRSLVLAIALAGLLMASVTGSAMAAASGGMVTSFVDGDTSDGTLTISSASSTNPNQELTVDFSREALTLTLDSFSDTTSDGISGTGCNGDATGNTCTISGDFHNFENVVVEMGAGNDTLHVKFHSQSLGSGWNFGSYSKGLKLKLYGGTGDDAIDVVAPYGELSTHLDDQVIYGGSTSSSGGTTNAGNNTIDLHSDSNGSVANDATSCGGYTYSTCSVLGDGNDTYIGSPYEDYVLGDEGVDTIYGGADSDYIQGGAGADSIMGGGDSDTLQEATESDVPDLSNYCDGYDSPDDATAAAADLAEGTEDGDNAADALLADPGSSDHLYLPDDYSGWDIPSDCDTITDESGDSVSATSSSGYTWTIGSLILSTSHLIHGGSSTPSPVTVPVESSTSLADTAVVSSDSVAAVTTTSAVAATPVVVSPSVRVRFLAQKLRSVGSHRKVRLQVRSTLAGRVKVSVSAKGKKAGSASVSVSANKWKTVTVRVSKKVAKALRKLARHRKRVAFSASGRVTASTGAVSAKATASKKLR